MTKEQNPNEHPHRRAVRNSIGFPEWAYDNLIHKYYVTWCEEIAEKFYYSDRELILNEKIFAYYQMQWSLLVEKQMVLDYGRYMQKNISDSANFYLQRIFEYGEELVKWYPASLLRDPMPKVKKNKIQNYQFNYN